MTTTPDSMLPPLRYAGAPGLDVDGSGIPVVAGDALDGRLRSDYDSGQSTVDVVVPARRGDTRTRHLCGDATALTASVVAAALAQAAVHRAATNPAVFLLALVRLGVCLPLLVVVLAASRHRLVLQVHTTIGAQLRDVAPPIAAAGLVSIGLWRWVSELSGTARPPEDGLVLSGVLGVLLVSLARVALHRATESRPRRILLVGSGAVAERVAERLEANGGVEILGFVDDDPKDPSACLGPLSELAGVCDCYKVDHVVVAFSRVPAEDLVQALRPVQGRLPISVVPRLFDVLPSTANAHDLASGYPAISVAPHSVGVLARAAKRTLDVLGAGCGLLVALPVLLVATAGVRCTSRGPVLLRQARVGLNGREFTVWKFRTFTVTESSPSPEILASGEQVAGPFPKLKNDPRTTAFGRVLRRMSIDELPQLLNVLVGSMSLVGPRPLQPEFAWSFGPWALRRYDMKPGLTGLWQVSGRNDLTYEEMCRLDSLYVTSWSPGLDARILARTLRAVLSGRGCY